MHMRVGMAGLAALYWPLTLGKGLKCTPDVAFVAATALGEREETLRATLGMSAQEYAERFGVRLYRTAEDMVKAEMLDTLVLIAPHSQHAHWVERLAPLDVRFFIPKTFATTMADAARIVACAERYHTQIAVGPSARFLPPFMAVKTALDEGRIGEPFALRLCHHHGTIDVFSEHDWYRDAAEGGPELSLGWYGIDLILHFLGQDVERISAEYGNFTTPDSPFMDYGRINLRMGNGTLAAFDMLFCNRFAYPSWQLEIVGTQGAISIHRTEQPGTQTVVRLERAQGQEFLPVPTQSPGWELFWVDDFLHARKPALDATQAAWITELSLAARQSAQSGQVISIS